MNQPRIEIVPVRPVVRADAATTVDVLLRITAPLPPEKVERPALNLGLVLDHSGSMGGHNKITFAREAACFAVEQLLPTDRVSVTVFDSTVETLVANTLAEDKARIVELIRRIQPGSSTALHGGWKEGGMQVAGHRLADGLNRVLLLSDGLANAGETNPDAIATDVHRLAKEGVSTTTLGLGDDYNEDLLEAMALSGDGNYYYIESPQQLPAIFQTELQGLMATFGSRVSLGIEPQEGVRVTEVLNDLERLPTGRLKLPNLVAGMPVLVVVRLEVGPAGVERDLCRFRLAWNGPKEEGRQSITATLRLPPVPASAWEALAPAVDVQERVALLQIARLKKAATDRMSQGDRAGAAACLEQAKAILAAAPRTPEIEREAQALAEIVDLLTEGAWMKFAKSAKYQTHMRRQSKPYP